MITRMARTAIPTTISTTMTTGTATRMVQDITTTTRITCIPTCMLLMMRQNYRS